jgi:predicted PurR-regulated permease PerM
VPVAALTTNLVAEAQNLWPAVRDYLGGDLFEQLALALEDSPFRPVLLHYLPESAQNGAAGIEDALRTVVSAFGDRVVMRLRDFTHDAPSLAISVAVTVLVYFFFLRHGPGWLLLLENAVPLAPGHAANLLQIAGRTINAVFRGVIITAAVQGTLAGIGFAVAGAPVPVILGAVTMVAALIPFVGPVFVWLPVSVALIATGRTTAGIGLFIWGGLVVSLVDNILRPFLIGRETKLPVLWLFLSILGGLRAFGFLGVLIGPAVLSLFLACYHIYMEGRRA